MEERRSTAGVWMAAILLLLLLPVTYLLSIGPAAAYYEHEENVPDVVIAIYAPLEWLSEESEWASDALEWYIELWVDE